MESILTSVKKILGISEDDESFDVDIIIHINTAFMILAQLGVDSAEGFAISDKSSTWDEVTPDDKSVEAIKTYIALKVRMIFDPPTSSSMNEAIKNTIAELESRILYIVDAGE